MDRWQILEEEARAGEQVRQCAVVIDGQRIDAGLDIGEVLPEQDRHVGVETPAIGHAHARLRALSGAFAHTLAQAPHHHAMADIPSNARHLPCAIGHARGELRHGIGHAVAPQWLGYSITKARRGATVPPTRASRRALMPHAPSFAARSSKFAAATSTGTVGATSPMPGPRSFGRATWAVRSPHLAAA